MGMSTGDLEMGVVLLLAVLATIGPPGIICPTPRPICYSDECCLPESPCSFGQGDCDEHDQCAAGLHCGVDNCEDDPTGEADCCKEKSCVLGDPLKTRPDWDCCSPSDPCSAGEGDCEVDADCKGTLRCGYNNYGDNDPTGVMDCCTPQISCKSGTSWMAWHCCTEENPCGFKEGVPEGDCNTDSECEGDLICGHDNCVALGRPESHARMDCCVPVDYTPPATTTTATVDPGTSSAEPTTTYKDPGTTPTPTPTTGTTPTPTETTPTPSETTPTPTGTTPTPKGTTATSALTTGTSPTPTPAPTAPPEESGTPGPTGTVTPTPSATTEDPTTSELVTGDLTTTTEQVTGDPVTGSTKTPEPSDTTPELDTTSEPSDTTSEQSDATLEPSDTTSEQSDATSEPSDTIPQLDATAEPSDTTPVPDTTTKLVTDNPVSANPAECPPDKPERSDPCDIANNLQCNYNPIYCCGNFAWFAWEMKCKDGKWVGVGDFGECSTDCSGVSPHLQRCKDC